MSDLIDRQAAIDAITQYLGRIKRDFKQWEGTARIILDHVPSAQPGWIPCSERLPFVGKVLAQTNDGTIHEVLYWGKNDYDQDAWARIDGVTYLDTEIVAWMPMPKPWEGEEHGET